MHDSENRPGLVADPACPSSTRSAPRRVLLAGLGNIGSFLAVLLAPTVEFIRLIDRDVVERSNTTNQLFEPEDAGRNKVDVVAERIQRIAPRLQVERRAADLQDLADEAFSDVDVGLAALDSLRARQIISERLFWSGVPLIDGAVGEPLLLRIQVLVPGQACLECCWGPAHYRQLSAEYPCRPGAAAAGTPTGTPSCAGAAAASLMVAELIKWSAGPQQSYEINGDLLAGRFVKATRRRNPDCRFCRAVARPAQSLTSRAR